LWYDTVHQNSAESQYKAGEVFLFLHVCFSFQLLTGYFLFAPHIISGPEDSVQPEVLVPEDLPELNITERFKTYGSFCKVIGKILTMKKLSVLGAKKNLMNVCC